MFDSNAVNDQVGNTKAVLTKFVNSIYLVTFSRNTYHLDLSNRAVAIWEDGSAQLAMTSSFTSTGGHHGVSN